MNEGYDKRIDDERWQWSWTWRKMTRYNMNWGVNELGNELKVAWMNSQPHPLMLIFMATHWSNGEDGSENYERLVSCWACWRWCSCCLLIQLNSDDDPLRCCPWVIFLACLLFVIWWCCFHWGFYSFDVWYCELLRDCSIFEMKKKKEREREWYK